MNPLADYEVFHSPDPKLDSTFGATIRRIDAIFLSNGLHPVTKAPLWKPKPIRMSGSDSAWFSNPLLRSD